MATIISDEPWHTEIICFNCACYYKVGVEDIEALEKKDGGKKHTVAWAICPKCFFTIDGGVDGFGWWRRRDCGEIILGDLAGTLPLQVIEEGKKRFAEKKELLASIQQGLDKLPLMDLIKKSNILLHSTIGSSQF